jgi:branched-chain amino acid aminotransferase
MKKQNIDWGNLKFEVFPTRSMWQAEGQAGNAWAKGELIPYGKVKMSPASCVMNYGQGVFEGLKAYHTARDRIVLFRPQMNAKRMGQSTQRICIPEITEDYFLEAVGQTVSDNIDFVPPYKQGSMYIRPISFGISPSISVGPSSDYLFIVFVSPVGPYFKGGVKPLHLIVSEKYHRAAPKGIGNAKAIGNYSASLLPGSKAKSAGFNEVIYMKASDEAYVEEMGAANLFSLTGNILKTPKLGGSILPGITRDSVIRIAKELMGLEVIEGDLTINELINADEVFCTGTAVVVTPIGFVTKSGVKHTVGSGEFGAITLELRKTLLGIQREEIDDTFGWVYPITN